jgi:hypothetical protein
MKEGKMGEKNSRQKLDGAMVRFSPFLGFASVPGIQHRPVSYQYGFGGGAGARKRIPRFLKVVEPASYSRAGHHFRLT